MGNATESTYACNQQRRRLQSRPRTTNEVSIMQRQRHAAIYRRLSTGRKHTELLQPNPLLMHNHVLPHTNGAAISQQRLEFENHLLSAINAQRCHALKPNKHTNCPWGPTYRRIKRRQDADYHKLFAQSSWYLLWLPRHARPKPNPPS